MTAAPAPIAMPVPSARAQDGADAQQGDRADRRGDHEPEAEAQRDDMHGANSRSTHRRGPRRAEPSGRLHRPDAGPPFARALLAALVATTVTLGGGGGAAQRDAARRQPLQRRDPAAEVPGPADGAARRPTGPQGRQGAATVSDQPHRQRRRRSAGAARRAQRPGDAQRLPLRVRLPSHPQPIGQAGLLPAGRLRLLQGDPRSGALLEVLAGGALRALDAAPRRHAREHDPHGPEALLLLPRPQARAHVRARPSTRSSRPAASASAARSCASASPRLGWTYTHPATTRTGSASPA